MFPAVDLPPAGPGGTLRPVFRTVWFPVFVVLSVGAIALGIGWLMGRTTSDGRVLEVRRTPLRAVREMTVEAFRELGRGYLEHRGYELTTDPEGKVLAVREERAHRVFFDPAAEAEDPRYLNRLIARLRRGNAEEGWLITSARLGKRARSLAERGHLQVAGPRTLITWHRRSQGDDSS